jgi:hypothetical protein
VEEKEMQAGIRPTVGLNGSEMHFSIRFDLIICFVINVVLLFFWLWQNFLRVKFLKGVMAFPIRSESLSFTKLRQG